MTSQYARSTPSHPDVSKSETARYGSAYTRTYVYMHICTHIHLIHMYAHVDMCIFIICRYIKACIFCMDMQMHIIIQKPSYKGLYIHPHMLIVHI